MSSVSTATATGQEPAPELGQIEAQGSANLAPPSPHSGLSKDPYRGAILVLLAAAFLAALGAVAGGLFFQNVILLDVAVTLGISTGILAGVVLAQRERAKPTAPLQTIEMSSADTPIETPPESSTQLPAETAPQVDRLSLVKHLLSRIVVEVRHSLLDVTGRELISRVKISTGAAGLA
jgi:hypothetical protein